MPPPGISQTIAAAGAGRAKNGAGAPTALLDQTLAASGAPPPAYQAPEHFAAGGRNTLGKLQMQYPVCSRLCKGVDRHATEEAMANAAPRDWFTDSHLCFWQQHLVQTILQKNRKFYMVEPATALPYRSMSTTDLYHEEKKNQRLRDKPHWICIPVSDLSLAVELLSDRWIGGHGRDPFVGASSGSLYSPKPYWTQLPSLERRTLAAFANKKLTDKAELPGLVAQARAWFFTKKKTEVESDGEFADVPLLPEVEHDTLGNNCCKWPGFARQLIGTSSMPPNQLAIHSAADPDRNLPIGSQTVKRATGIETARPIPVQPFFRRIERSPPAGLNFHLLSRRP
ncbi:hypothetical protein H2201_001822 [Coniosporium apollinis]|uniref:Uncharacterized protein n=1 Tax=Coniosporium apollinis TaxID=61459 RepID=A0ABQ9P3W4_9PEZI|nr:hypothetical protein H2201_001822 [Coniosporium apollinis]